MTGSTCVAWGNRSSSFYAWAAIVLGVGLAVAGLALAPTLAFAEAQVRGNPNAVSVEAKDASVEEILVALSDAFDVHFRSSANLEKRLTGTYVGTLQQVVTHVLRGFNFVMKSGDKGIEITLLGTGKTITVGGVSSAPKVAVRRTEAAAEPSPAADAAVQPVPVASSTGPLPVIRLAEGAPPIPLAAPPASGSAPAPVPGTATADAPSPAPPAPGSKPSPVPTPGTASAAVLPPPPVGTADLSASPPATVPAAPAPPSATPAR
jgi:hypothetical protein